MHLLRLTILIAFSTLWFADANHAVATPIPVGPEYTYVFTAGPEEDTSYNGSTISIQDFNIVSWNLFGDSHGGLTTGDGSFVSSETISSYDQITWTGSFTVTSFFQTLSYSGTNTTNPVFDPGSLDSTFHGDPGGTWTAVAAPDSGTTFALLAIACGGLGLYGRRARAT